ncbi:MAG: ABC transporter permease [Bacteroidales bacterium]|nr:ABC transporter permease [Bacteroidales bacterium]
MKTIIIIAWRNLWRNKRRTLITAASVFFGVIFSTVMSSMQEGSYDSNVKNSVRFYTGYLQIQHQDYWEEKTLENHLTYDKALFQRIQQNAMVKNITPRLEYFALASRESATKVAQVTGINPDMEKEVTNITSNIEQGRYLEKGDAGVVIGSLLAENLGLGVGDTITLTGQGYRYATAAGLFPVVGIVDFPSQELNKTMVYMALKTCQQFYNAPDMLTSVSVMITDNDKLAEVQNKIGSLLPEDYTTMNWKEMMPALVQQIESDRAGGYIFMAILYMIILFGILGTIMMMIAERRRELGVMMAVGMKRLKLAAVIIIETFFIGVLGAITGILGSIPIVGYYVNNPIPLEGKTAEVMESYGWEPFMFFSSEPRIFYLQAIIVFILTVVVAIYPVTKIFTMKEINALRA